MTRNEKDANTLPAHTVAQGMGLRFAELRILAHDVLGLDIRPGSWIKPSDVSVLQGAYDEMMRIEPSKVDGIGVEFCPVCFDPIDYCQGHGSIGDPVGHALQKRMDNLDG